jgi:hypothetical protein
VRSRILLVALTLIAASSLMAGCGSSGEDQSHPTTPGGLQSSGAIPGTGSRTAPNVTTTAGKAAKEEPGPAGGGSGGTCIGC